MAVQPALVLAPRAVIFPRAGPAAGRTGGSIRPRSTQPGGSAPHRSSGPARRGTPMAASAVRRELGAAPPPPEAAGKDGVVGVAAAWAGPGAALLAPPVTAAGPRGAEAGHRLAAAVR